MLVGLPVGRVLLAADPAAERLDVAGFDGEHVGPGAVQQEPGWVAAISGGACDPGPFGLEVEAHPGLASVEPVGRTECGDPVDERVEVRTFDIGVVVLARPRARNRFITYIGYGYGVMVCYRFAITSVVVCYRFVITRVIGCYRFVMFCYGFAGFGTLLRVLGVFRVRAVFVRSGLAAMVGIIRIAVAVVIR